MDTKNKIDIKLLGHGLVIVGVGTLVYYNSIVIGCLAISIGYFILAKYDK